MVPKISGVNYERRDFAAILLAMTGILNPVVGALVHNAGSVFVIVNSAFLLKAKDL